MRHHFPRWSVMQVSFFRRMSQQRGLNQCVTLLIIPKYVRHIERVDSLRRSGSPGGKMHQW
jgi:hypothetical protein